jgi:hypothetical protein
MMLTRTQLDRAQCSTPGCTHEDHREMFLHAKCHLDAGLTVAYNLATGSMLLRCIECGRPIAEVAVAP